jgi:hypothetical protein
MYFYLKDVSLIKPVSTRRLYLAWCMWLYIYLHSTVLQTNVERWLHSVGLRSYETQEVCLFEKQTQLNLLRKLTYQYGMVLRSFQKCLTSKKDSEMFSEIKTYHSMSLRLIAGDENGHLKAPNVTVHFE